MMDFIAKAQKWVNDNFIFALVLTTIGILILIYGATKL